MEKLKKRACYGDDNLLEFYKREIGLSLPRNFTRRISSSQAMVKRLDLYGKLTGHEGCVNTIDFNAIGDVLVSGSDDRRVILWDWATGTSKLSYPSGHMDNIFQAKFMPCTDDDRNIITASADGQVRLGSVLENGRVETKRVGKHQGRVHKLALEPGSPYIFYSCGEDGFVQHYDLRSNSSSKLLRCSSFLENNKQSGSIRLNGIVIDPRNPNYFAVGGSDEYARVYDIRMYQLDARTSSDRPINTFCPHHLIKTHDVHITALAYSNSSELLVSYNDELIYLFQKNMGLGPAPLSLQGEDLEKLETPKVYSGHRNSQTVKGVSFFGPNDEYVLTGSDCGHIFIWKKKDAKLVRLMVGDKHIVNQLKPHPCIPVLATCGIEKTIKLWAPSSNDVTALPHDVQEIMEANRRGREGHSRVTLTPDMIMHVLRLHRRQALAYIERRDNEDDDSDEDDGGGAYAVLGFSDGEEGENSECSIS